MWVMSVAILGFLNGGWMVFDGVHVLRHGKYFGPDTPGPWVRFPKMFGIDPFRMGPVFVGLGLLWLVSASNILVAPQLMFWPMITAAVLTLWYVKIGTVISVVVLVLLMGPAHP